MVIDEFGHLKPKLFFSPPQSEHFSYTIVLPVKIHCLFDQRQHDSSLRVFMQITCPGLRIIEDLFSFSSCALFWWLLELVGPVLILEQAAIIMLLFRGSCCLSWIWNWLQDTTVWVRFQAMTWRWELLSILANFIISLGLNSPLSAVLQRRHL